MLVQRLSSPQEKLQHLEAFDDRTSTWVVADLQSKAALKSHFLERRGFILADSVIRASELWQVLLGRIRPDLTIISADFARNWMADFIEDQQVSWAQTSGAARLLYDYITQLMPVLSHPEGDTQLLQWFEQRPDSFGRWGNWYRLADQAWRELLRQGLIASPWVSGVLINENRFEMAWRRPLTLDLGAELNGVEADLIVRLARFTDVTVLEPAPTWAQRFERGLRPYGRLPEAAPKAFVEKKSEPPPITCHKFPTMLAEVKFATAQLREWANQGIRLDQMAVVMPDVECYWPALQCYLEEEGLAVQKSRVTLLHCLPEMARWLARLRLKSGLLTSADLELCTFGSEGEPPLSYDRFTRLFAQIYSRGDFQRHEQLLALYGENMSRDKLMDRGEFIAWSLQFWPEEQDPDCLERFYRQVYQECPGHLQMKLKRWLDFGQHLASRIELPVSDGRFDGVAVTNLAAARSLTCSHFIVLGLSESALRRVSSTNILYGDVLSLSSGLGFELTSPDQDTLEFAARWLLDDNKSEFHLSFATTDFNGAALAPSLLWLERALEQECHEKTSVPPATRWDEIQHADLEVVATLRDWPESQQLKVVQSIELDLGWRKPLPLKDPQTVTLSASSLERYLGCPFVFAAEKLMKLNDVEALDMDIDARTRGQLMHALFEALLQQDPLQSQWSEEQLTELVDQCRRHYELEVGDEALWPSVRGKYVALAQRFMAAEVEMRKRFPKVKTRGVEAMIDGFMAADGTLHREPVGQSFHFRGKIDRVDCDDQDRSIIFDYKTSRSGDKITAAPNWVVKQSLQLALYAMAVEAGVVKDRPGLPYWSPLEVTGAFFFIAKGLSREVGLRLEEFEDVLYPGNRYMKRLNLESKQALFQSVRELLGQVLSRIQGGEFAPIPHSLDDCERCRWSSLCRAPHLN